ncbi:metallophosphoesterase family protein [Streptomyces sp. ODS28]|uniref:metallophosphoesterase family protein n=1 Tax=Streptomyces sp. ODS28 TaxID=3136688 RepID=UPI0031ED88F1
MPNRTAVLSDIHGVLPALRAVLDEPEVRAAERIVLTGDIAAGPQPVQVLDTLARLGERAVWIAGNADRELLEYRRGERDTLPDPVSTWAARQLRADQLDLLAGLPRSARLPVRGLGTVEFCHATPRDDEEVVLVDSRLERWREVFAGLGPEVAAVVLGHTHMPFVRVADGRLVVNPGSVGMPYGLPGAHWALLGPGAELRTTHFDVEAAVREVLGDCSCAEAAEWADSYLRSCPSDAEALEVFGALDGRGPGSGA